MEFSPLLTAICQVSGGLIILCVVLSQIAEIKRLRSAYADLRMTVILFSEAEHKARGFESMLAESELSSVG